MIEHGPNLHAPNLHPTNLMVPNAGQRPSVPQRQSPDGWLGVPIPLVESLTGKQPALRLMIAVLEQAVDDLQTNRSANELSRRALYLDAYTWASSSDRSHAFTFLNVCEALGYSPTAVRRRVLHEPPPPLRPRKV
jgi:hypothetical protein